MKRSWVYMMANKSNSTVYIGVTSNIVQRVWQHKTKFYKGFTSRYNCDKLVYFEEFQDIRAAIVYEKKLKGGNRARKNRLITEQNPEWKDLSDCFPPFHSGRNDSSS